MFSVGNIWDFKTGEVFVLTAEATREGWERAVPFGTVTFGQVSVQP